MIDGKYFDSGDILTRSNGVVNGSRSIGKSEGQKRRAICRRQRNHEATVWVRFTEEEADVLAGAFGNGKWKKLEKEYGIEGKLKLGKGRRILYDHNGTWVPMIRYVGLSEWQKQRDIDDPQERHIFFDEYIVPDSKLKTHLGGPPAEHFMDMWISLRRGKPQSHPMTFLLAGNPELGIDWFTPYLGIDDKKRPESIVTYELPEAVRKRYSDDDYDFDRFTVMWTTNPNGAGLHNGVSGYVQGMPENLLKRRSGFEQIYAQFDFGGFISIWYGDRCMIVDTVKGQANTIKDLPDGYASTVVMTPKLKKDLVYLREYWNAGRVFFTSPDAYHRFINYTAHKVL